MRNILQFMTDTPVGGTVYIYSAGSLAFSLLITLLLSGVMVLVYRLCHDSLTYNRKFNILLVMLAAASNVLLALIQNNPLFSLGALGALSICRIRTNTKDPRDLGFVFWALMIGISSALGAFVAGGVGTLALSLILFWTGEAGKKKKVVTVVVRGEKDAVAAVQEVFGTMKGTAMQSKNLSEDAFELVYDLRVPKEEEEKLLLLLNGMKGICGVNILAPQTNIA